MSKRLTAIIVLIFYSSVLIDILVFKNLPTFSIGGLRLKLGGTRQGPANLVPFRSISAYLTGRRGLLTGAINLVGNIILLLPAGFLVPLVCRGMSRTKSLFLAFGAGLAIEGMQVLFRVGIFDVDDVLLNALGVMIGFWCFTRLSASKSAQKVLPKNNPL